MKKRFFIAPLIVFVVVIAACNSDATKSLNEYIAETEEAVERMADLLAQTEDRETETEEQITELDEAAAETDEKVDGLSGALANLQSAAQKTPTIPTILEHPKTLTRGLRGLMYTCPRSTRPTYGGSPRRVTGYSTEPVPTCTALCSRSSTSQAA